jgi:hypothetical protein
MPEDIKKAGLLVRTIAKILDFIIIAAALEIIPKAGFFAGLAYLLIGDGLFDGRSLGKKLIGIKVVSADMLTPCSFRESIFSKYHDTASVAGIYKYEQAKELIEDNNAFAPEVRSEAAARGVDVLVLAARIIDNHESFRNKEAKIAGIRGKIWDRLQTFEFDLENPDTSYAEFLSSEVIGTQTEKSFEDDELIEKEVDITVNKYTLALGRRFQYE